MITISNICLYSKGELIKGIEHMVIKTIGESPWLYAVLDFNKCFIVDKIVTEEHKVHIYLIEAEFEKEEVLFTGTKSEALKKVGY